MVVLIMTLVGPPRFLSRPFLRLASVLVRTAGRDQFIQLPAVEPDPPALRTVIDLDPLPLRHRQRTLIYRTLHNPNYNKRPGVKIKFLSTERRAVCPTPVQGLSRRRIGHANIDNIRFTIARTTNSKDF